MNYGNIKECDIADGPGVRVTLFVSGCRHHCKGCFNSETWNFQYGVPFTEETQDKSFKITGTGIYFRVLPFLGENLLEPENQAVLVHLLKKIRETYPQKDIWCYSGYLFDQDMQPGGSVYTEYTKEMLRQIDVLVDGEFVEAKKDLTLIFRGSSNQRLLRLKDGEFAGMWED